MPARIRIETTDGVTLSRRIPVAHWLMGETSAQIRGSASAGEVIRVEIDPFDGIPDVDLDNNVWERGMEES
jgi:hypothetical protein